MNDSNYMASTMLLGMARIIPIVLFAAAGWFVFIKLPFFVFLKVLKNSRGQNLQPVIPEYKVEPDSHEFKPGYNVANYEAFLRRSRRGKDEDDRVKKEIEEYMQYREAQKNETPEQKKERQESNERRKKYAEELKARAEEQMRAKQEQKIRQKEAEKVEKERAARVERERVAREEKERKDREEKQYQEYFNRKSRKENTSSFKQDSPEALFNIKPGENFTQEELKKKYRELLKQHHPDKVASEGTQVRKLADKKTQDINSAYEKLKSKAA